MSEIEAGRYDCVLVLGCRLNIRQVSYAWQNFARAAELIVVDVDAAELKKPTIKPTVAVHAELVIAGRPAWAFSKIIAIVDHLLVPCSSRRSCMAPPADPMPMPVALTPLRHWHHRREYGDEVSRDFVAGVRELDVRAVCTAEVVCAPGDCLGPYLVDR